MDKTDRKKTVLFTESAFNTCFVLLVLFMIPAFFWNKYVFAAEAAIALLLFAYHRAAVSKRRRALDKYIKESVIKQENLSGSLMLSFPLPMAVVLMENRTVVWANERFTDMVGSAHVFDKPITEICPELTLDWITEGGSVFPGSLAFGSRRYTLNGNLFSISSTGMRGLLAVIYFTDRTELLEAQEKMQDDATVIAEIVWDNYEEIGKNCDDSARSQITAKLDEAVNEWVSAEQGFMKKSAPDRFLLLFSERACRKFIDSNFDILNRASDIVAPESGMPVTVSVGVGRGEETLAENLRGARIASEMAMSRGGNQAVVRKGTNFEFFGGRVVETERSSQVRSRIMANVLGNLVEESSNVVVMTHRGADADGLGAAAAVARIAQHYGKPFYVVVDRVHCDSPRIMEMLSAEEGYGDAFIDAQSAMVVSNSKSLLVVVDTSRRDYTEAPDLIDSFSRIAVIDHHRRSADYIMNASLNIQETVASSTCEMLCEMLQFIVPADKIRVAEATAMLAGIILDTRGFTVKTGSRAFETAAFLRRVGADPVTAKRTLQGNAAAYIEKTRLAGAASVYRDAFVIAVTPEETERAVAAQAADSLLDISGIQASFTVFSCDGETCISGRSLGQVNVQMILEKMGGGGQLTSAGAQLRDTGVEEAAETLRGCIDRYLETSPLKSE